MQLVAVVLSLSFFFFLVKKIYGLFQLFVFRCGLGYMELLVDIGY